MEQDLQQFAASQIAALHGRCHADAPNFGVSLEDFSNSVVRSVEKYVVAASTEPLTETHLSEFFENLQADDLFMALACSNGNERAWWEFDQQHRSYMERVSRHLAKTEVDASEVVDAVYVELYGTRVVDGRRISKFATYSGRGSLRGWLRTVIWHSVVDLHRAGHDEVSLDAMTENIGEGAAHATFAMESSGGEEKAVSELVHNRYRAATVASLTTAFGSLDDHEKLLLKYYHVDSLKLREIARLAENPSSPLRKWFQRRSQNRETDPNAKVYESTVMRWLEKSYATVLDRFKRELASVHSLNPDEVELCLGLASEDIAGNNFYRDLAGK